MKARAMRPDRSAMREEATRVSKVSGVSFQDALDLLLIHDLRQWYPDNEELVTSIFEFERELHARDQMREVTRDILAILGVRTETGERITPMTDLTELAGQKIWAYVRSADPNSDGQ